METYLRLVNEQLESSNRKEAIRESSNTFGKILARKGSVNWTSTSSNFFINYYNK